MKKIICLLCFCAVSVQSMLVLSQDRGGNVRLRVRDERGNLPKDEAVIYANSYALLIGNTRYQDRAWSDLPDVDEDIAAVKDVLENQHGFRVEVALNQNRDALLRTIDQFISKYGQRYNNRLLIYYSGHGYTALLSDERKMGYLVLPDAPAMPGEERALRIPPTDEEFERFLPAAITMDEVETYARRIAAKHVLFVFDSCFSGTVLYKDMGTSVPPLITTEELKPVRAYLTAGNETQRVPAFSKFRRKFVAGLMGEADTNGDGYILSSELGRWVSIEVEKDTGRKQTPVFGKSDIFRRGDIIFISPKKQSSSERNNPLAQTTVEPKFGSTTSAVDNEREAFVAIQNSTVVNEIRAVLEEYPTSRYARDLRKRLDKLVWESVKNSHDKAKIQAYLDEFGDKGQFAPLARIEIRKLTLGQPKPLESTNISNNQANSTLENRPPSSPYIRTDEFKEIARKILKYKDAWHFLNYSEGLVAVPRFLDGDANERESIPNLAVELNGQSLKYSYINNLGDEVIPLKYWNAERFSEGLAAVKVNGKYGFIDKTGVEIIPLKFSRVGDFSEGLAWVCDYPNGCSFIDKVGRKVLSLKNNEVSSFSEGLAAVKKNAFNDNGKFYYIDKTGKKLFSTKYEYALSFSEGLAAVREDILSWGFIDKTGKLRIPLKYWDAKSFSNGLAAVKILGKWGFIDKTGKEMITHKYDSAASFTNGLAKVGIKVNEIFRFGFIDQTGKEIIPIRYDRIWCDVFLDKGIVGVTLDGKKGFVDIYGNEYFDF